MITPRLEGSAREQKEREALREAVISPNGSTQLQQVEVKTEPLPSPSSTSQMPSSELADRDEHKASSSTSPHSSGANDAKSDSEAPVVEALRGRIRELEAEMRVQPFKCLICMVSWT